MFELWPHQRYAVTSVLDAQDRGVKRLLLSSPTGAGKTRVACDLIDRWCEQGLKVVLYSNRRMLVDQTDRVLNAAQIDHGVRAAGYMNKDSAFMPVQVSSLQTEQSKVFKRKTWQLHAAQRVLLDEAHLNKGPMVRKILDAHLKGGAMYVGLTATPLDLGDLYDQLIVAGTTSELRDCGALVPALHYGPDEPDLRKIKTPLGLDLTEKENIKAVMTRTIFGRVVDWLLRLNPELKPSILFAPGVKESLWFAEQLSYPERRQEAELRKLPAIKAAHIDGQDVWVDGELYPTSRQAREDVLARCQGGEIKVITNRFVLREGVDCLDAKTEILTANGWRGMGAIQQGDVVYSLNHKTERLELDVARRVFARPLRDGERLVRLRSQHLNIRVSEGHVFWLKLYNKKAENKRADGWLRSTGADLLRRRTEMHLPLTALPDPTLQPHGLPLSDDELRFIAWYVTDGYCPSRGKNKAMQIGQSKDYHNEIRALLVRLGYHFKEYTKPPRKTGCNSKRLVHQFVIAARGWRHLLPYLDKSGSPLWRLLTRDQFWTFWVELMKGDGQITTGTRKQYRALAINNQPMADLLQELAAARGFASNLHTYRTKKNKQMWGLTVRDRQWICTRPSDPRATTITAEEPAPGEMVWCVTTRNGSIVTRREGKVIIIGNCPWLCHGILASVFGSLQTYLQAGGRLLRAAPGKGVCTIQDHGGNYWRHGSLNADREWQLEDTSRVLAGLREEALRAKKCQRCGYRPLVSPLCPRCRTANVTEPMTCPECKRVLTGLRCPCGYVIEYTKRTRTVIQVNGLPKEMPGDIYRPRRVYQGDDAAQKWERMYYRARSKKWNASFAQAAALFAAENNWNYPGRDLPLMPRQESDWFRPVSQVPRERLIQPGEKP
jgi:superfamily II DNA or RNA helicase